MQKLGDDENNMNQDKIKLGSSKQISYQQHNTKFGIINESEQNDESMGKTSCFFMTQFTWFLLAEEARIAPASSSWQLPRFD